MENKRNNSVEDILNSLDGSQRAAAPNFFYTRLKARMEKGLAPRNNQGWKLRPVYVITVLLLVLAMNVVVLLRGNNNDNSFATIDTDSDQSIAAEYNLYENNIVYDLNQDK